MKTHLFTLTAKSNLHVGAGGSNYGVIDNLVQRDCTDNFPAIYASSLKGAFRQWYKASAESKEVEKTFGSFDEGKASVLFSDAHLLALPVRSNHRPYLLATSPYLLAKFQSICADDFGVNFSKELSGVLSILTDVAVEKGEPLLIGESPAADMRIEGYDTIGRFPETANPADRVLLVQLQALLGHHSFVLLDDEDMKAQCSDYELPVIARNCLENGQSTNLWYEQIVPRLTCYYFLMEEIGHHAAEFTKSILSKPIVQIGANATIGYGRCTIEPLNLPKHEND